MPKPASTAREQALRALLAIEEGAYANLTGREASLSDADRRFANELIAGVTRRRQALDWVLSKLLTRPLDALTPSIRNILRLGAYQLLYSRVPARAAVDESVKLAHRHGHAGVAKLVNGVLRNLDRRREALTPPTFATAPLEALEARYSLPKWLAERWLAAYGPEAEALGEWSLTPPGLAVRANTLKTTPEALFEAFSAAGVQAEPSPVAPEGLRVQGTVDVTALPGYNEGWFYVQDEGAMLVSRCLAPLPDDTVIDVGAAPGGKTTHLAQLMDNRGAIYAVDQNEGRLRLLAENCARLGVDNVKAIAQSGADLAGLPEADRILLDVPCSGLGVLPRKPDLRWRQTPDTIAGLTAVQDALLSAAAARLRPGGTMVYSTCTISPEENQARIHRFLAQHPNFTLSAIAPCLPEAWRQDVEEGGMIQLLPHRHGVDGFFIAKLRRTP